MNYLHWSLYVIINTLLCSIYLTSFYKTSIRLFKYVFSVSHPWPTYTKEQLRLAFREFGKKPRLPSVMPASQWYIRSFTLSTWWFIQIFINLYMKWILNFEDKNELVLNWNMHTPIHRKKKKSKFTHQKKVYKTTSRQVKNMVIFEKFLPKALQPILKL